jgi:hypothetical protein
MESALCDSEESPKRKHQSGDAQNQPSSSSLRSITLPAPQPKNDSDESDNRTKRRESSQYANYRTFDRLAAEWRVPNE